MLAAVSRSLAGGTPLGASRWGTFLRCPREYRYRHVENLAKADAGPKPAASGGGLLGGSLLHAVLAAYYETTRLWGGRPSAEAVRDEFDEASAWLSADEKTVNTIWGCFERYVAWESEAYAYWVPEAIEVPLEIGGVLTAKADLVVRDSRSGQVFAVDHKLASAERGSLETSYRLGPEVVTTLLCARDGHVASGVGWPGMAEGAEFTDADGLGPGASLALAYVFINQVFPRAAPPPARGASVTVRDQVLDAYLDMVKTAAAKIFAWSGATAKGGEPKLWTQVGLVTKACGGSSFGGPCEFLDLCASGGRTRGLYTIREVG